MKTKQFTKHKLWLFLSVIFLFTLFFLKPVSVKAALPAPTNFRQTDGADTNFKVEWDGVINAYQYGIQYSTDPNNELSWSSEERTTYCSKTYYSNISAGKTYYVRIRTYTSYNDSSYGNWSKPIEVNTAPSQISNLTQTSCSKNGVTVTWSPSGNATGYDIYYGTNYALSSASYYKSTNTTSINITGFPANSEYYVFVVPYRISAHSTLKAVDTYSYKSCITLPSIPTNLKVSDRSSSTTKFSWTSTSTYNNTSGYQVEIRNASNKKLKTLTSNNFYSTYTSFTSSKLFTAPFQYRIRSYVTLNNKKIYSAWSSYKKYIPGAVVKTLSYSNYRSTTGILKWKKVKGAKSYTVYWKSTYSGSWKVVAKNVKRTSAKVKCKASNLNNYYYVRANKVKFGKKKYSSAGVSSTLDAYYVN